MIPSLQLMIAGPVPLPLPVEGLPDAEGFAALVDQPAATQSDGAAILAMIAMMPLPAPLPKSTPLQPPPDLPDHGLPAGPLAGSVLAEPRMVDPHLTDMAAQDQAPEQALPVPPPPAAAAIAPDHAAKAPETDPWASLPVLTAKAYVQPVSTPPDSAAAKPADIKEVAFLARIEPQSPPLATLAPVMPSPEAAVVAPVMMPGNPMPKVAAAERAEVVVEPEDTYTPRDMAARQAVTSVEIPHAAILPKSDLEDLAGAEPQIMLAPAPDRTAMAAAAVAVPLPTTVPAALIAQAPQAALGPVEVVLNPEELGKVRFEIHQQGDHVKVILAVERPETLDLLRRHADQLVQEFRAAGYTGASLSFGHWGGQQGGNPGQTARTEPDFAPPDILRPPPPPPRNVAPSQGLNLRL